MTATTDQRLYILSFDHRGSFKKGLMGIAGEPTGQQREQISELKTVIYEGFERAVVDGAPRHACGVLVDEEFGAEIARSARAAGFTPGDARRALRSGRVRSRVRRRLRRAHRGV